MASSLKVLVTGGSGLLGRAILEEGKARGYEMTGLAFSRVGTGLLKCDLTQANEFEKVLNEKRPDIIIHAAAQRFPDKVDNDYEATLQLNVEVSGRLALASKKIGSRFIYISTDYVFDGKSPPYKITDTPNPVNKYGQTKYEGENAVIANNEDACILRIPILYGNVEYLGESAVTVLLTDVKGTDQKSINHTQQRYPSHTRDIARILCDLSTQLIKDMKLNGIFQWCGKEQLTKYKMAITIAEALGLSKDHIKPDLIPSTNVTRPDNCQMDTSRLENLGISHHTLFSQGIQECLSKWV